MEYKNIYDAKIDYLGNVWRIAEITEDEVWINDENCVDSFIKFKIDTFLKFIKNDEINIFYD